MRLILVIYGCIWLFYTALYGWVAAAAAAAQHDYTGNFRNTCAFRPQLAYDLTRPRPSARRFIIIIIINNICIYIYIYLYIYAGGAVLGLDIS